MPRLYLILQSPSITRLVTAVVNCLGVKPRSTRLVYLENTEQPGTFTRFVSVVLLFVQLLKEPASRRPDTNAVDVAHLEVSRGGTERIMLDEDATDDRTDGFCPVSVHGGCHRRVEMRILVIFSRVLCALEHELNYLVDRCVLGVSGSFTNVVQGVAIGSSLFTRGVSVCLCGRWLKPTLPADLGKSIFERCQTVDGREFVGDLVEKHGSLDSGLVSFGRLNRFDANLSVFVPATGPTISGNLNTLVFFGRKERVGK